MAKRSSTTAQVTALARAALSGPQGPLKDRYAEQYLQVPWRYLRKSLRSTMKNWPWFRELLSNVGGRTCFYDEIVQSALESGVRQVVVLGAGYDSRAMRFARPNVTFFEVDAPATQQNKLSQLEYNCNNSQAVFVPVDFESDDLKTSLLQAGFNTTAPTLFLWEGVVEYLTSDVVSATLHQLHEMSPSGSVLAFDPLFPQNKRTKLSLLRKLATKVINALGEPRLFSIHPDHVADFISQAGWKLDTMMSANELHDKYLKDVIKPPRFVHNYVVSATKL